MQSRTTLSSGETVRQLPKGEKSLDVDLAGEVVVARIEEMSEADPIVSKSHCKDRLRSVWDCCVRQLTFIATQSFPRPKT